MSTYSNPQNFNFNDFQTTGQQETNCLHIKNGIQKDKNC